MKRRLLTFLLAGTLIIVAAMPAAAAPRAGPCAPGIFYDSGCDVDHDGDVDIVDIQLISGHFGRSGVWVGDPTWSLTGNAGTIPGTNFLGTTDNKSLDITVNDTGAVRIQPTANGSPNIVRGYEGNTVAAGTAGATIGGGGALNINHRVADNFGVVAGGANNRAGNTDLDPVNAQYAVASGGTGNVALEQGATVSGGENNRAGNNQAVVGGGMQNLADGVRTIVGGGINNNALGLNAAIGGGSALYVDGENARASGGAIINANGQVATVGGGFNNEATSIGSTIGGGSTNLAYPGSYGTIAGGGPNTAGGAYSLAAGYQAKAITLGTFVWADNTTGEFVSIGANTFRVRASSGSDFRANNTNYGMYLINAGSGRGLETYASTSQGTNWAALYASNSGTSPALYANSNGTYAGYFADQISVNGGCTGCSLMFVAVNAGDEAVQPGDVVAALGVDSPLAGRTDPVLRIRRADVSGVTGIVHRRVTVTRSTRDGELLDSVQAVDGAVQPGEYLLIVVQGLAQVRVSAGEGITPGQRLTVDDIAGRARARREVEPRGLNTPIVGITLDVPDATTGLAPVLVTALAN